MVILVVASLKGGSAGTTSAAYLGRVLANGDRVLLVGVYPQRSLLRWAHIADWTITTTALPASRLHRDLRAITGDRFDAVVIDTPPHGDACEQLLVGAHQDCWIPVSSP
jgi:chromosome partitioning protein